MAKDNRSLGRFHLDGIMPAPRGVPQVEISIDIDANGVLSVSAKDKATGKENKIRIEGGSQLSKEEIEKMKQEAEDNAEQDRQERESIDKINQADGMIFQTEKQIKEFGEKLTEENKEKLNTSLDKLKEAHKMRDLIKIDESMNEMNETWGKISTELYSQTESNESPTDPNTGTEEVEFEEVK
jgi:molecular chaperone DnaK